MSKFSVVLIKHIAMIVRRNNARQLSFLKKAQEIMSQCIIIFKLPKSRSILNAYLKVR